MQQKERIHLIPNAYIIAQSYCKNMQDSLGLSFGITLVEYLNGVMYWYASEAGVKKVAKQALVLVKKDKIFLNKIIKKYNQKMLPLAKLASGIYKTNLNKKTNQELWQMFDKYLKLYKQAYPWSEPIVLGLEESLGSYLKEYLSKKINNSEELTTTYSILSAPREKSFAKQEEDDLLNIALKIKNKKNINLEKVIKIHAQKYSWLPYDYGLDLWNEKYFSIVLDHILKQGDMESRLLSSKRYFNQLPKQQTELEKKYKIDKVHKDLFNNLRLATYLQDYKKGKFTLVHYYIVGLLEEIAKRLNIQRELMQYYLPKELEKALLNNLFVKDDELKNRSINSLFVFNQNSIKIFLGAEASKILMEHKKIVINKKSLLLGVTASAGCYIGKVRIIREASEIKNIKKGEVLITTMTSPEYVPALRLAGAVVTDQGGIMCHAAILSREIGVPCIVGTGLATKLFQTGDVVEVNADQNFVRIKK